MKTPKVRPITVKYYTSPHDMPDHWTAQGHCKSEVGVLRGAMVRLFLREYVVARVYKEGICIMTLRLRKDGLPEAKFGPHILGTVQTDGTIRYA